MRLKFSKANAKLKKLTKVKGLAKYLKNGRKVYSLDLLSGWSCPFAQDCLSKVVRLNNKSTIKDGPDTLFRCFSASQEALLPAVYNLRKHNYNAIDLMLKANIGRLDLANWINEQLPTNLGILRFHVGGDFFNQTYFDAAALVARKNPDRLFYAYTKSLKYWTGRLGELSDNFVLTASRGGRLDYMIDEYDLREAKVIAEPEVCSAIAASRNQNKVPNLFSIRESYPELIGLPIDHDDSHAANPRKRNQSFCLLVHGVQPKDSEASKAKSILKGVGSYSR